MSSAVDDEDIIEVLTESDDVELTTTAVADELPISRGYTRTRLQRLVDDGRMERRREGNSIVWWLPDRAGDEAATEEGADADEAGAEDSDAAEESDAEAEESDAEAEAADADEADEDADEGPQSVEVEAVASEEDDEGAADGESAAGDGEAADEDDEKPATATGAETAASRTASDGEPSDAGESAGPAERPTVRVHEHDAPASRGGPDSLARILGVAALVLLVYAVLRRLRRR